MKYTLRVHAIPLADDHGGRAFASDAANLAKGLARANQALANASVELVFDPKKDWHPRNDTALSNLANGGATGGAKAMRWRRESPAGSSCSSATGRVPIRWGEGHGYPPSTTRSTTRWPRPGTACIRSRAT